MFFVTDNCSDANALFHFPTRLVYLLKTQSDGDIPRIDARWVCSWSRSTETVNREPPISRFIQENHDARLGVFIIAVRELKNEISEECNDGLHSADHDSGENRTEDQNEHHNDKNTEALHVAHEVLDGVWCESVEDARAV